MAEFKKKNKTRKRKKNGEEEEEEEVVREGWRKGKQASKKSQKRTQRRRAGQAAAGRAEPGHVLPAPGRRLLPLAGFAPPGPGVRAPAPSPCRPPLLAVLCRATWGGWSGGFYFLCRGKRGQEIKMLAEPSSHQPQARLRRRAPRPRRQRLRGRGTFLRHPALPGHGPSVGPLGALRARASRPARPPVCLQSTGETGGRGEPRGSRQGAQTCVLPPPASPSASVEEPTAVCPPGQRVHRGRALHAGSRRFAGLVLMRCF